MFCYDIKQVVGSYTIFYFRREFFMARIVYRNRDAGRGVRMINLLSLGAINDRIEEFKKERSENDGNDGQEKGLERKNS